MKNVPEYYATAVYPNATEAWEGLYKGLNKYGDESSPRGLKVRETLGCDIRIMNPNECVVMSPIRNMSASYLAAEWLWYLSGDRSLESISKHSSFWKKIANPDGTVNSNYGAYMFVNGEWDKVKNSIINDHDTRQAVLQIPITRNIGAKDTPCTSSIQFILRDNKLNMTVYMRSNDVWRGFAYDVHCFAMMQLKMLRELNEATDELFELGWYRHVVGSLHVYEPEFIENIETANEVLMSSPVDTVLKSSDSYHEDLVHLVNKEYELVENKELKQLITMNNR